MLKFESQQTVNCFFLSQPTLTRLSVPLLCCFFSPCCLTYKHMARSDTFSQSTSAWVQLFLARVVRVGIKLLTQDHPDVPDNLNHSSSSWGLSLKMPVGHQQGNALCLLTVLNIYWKSLCQRNTWTHSSYYRVTAASQAAGERSLS